MIETKAALLLVFIAGIAVGALITSRPRLRIGGKRRTELLHARERILAGVKEKHDREMLREIFQAADAVNGELNKSLHELQAFTRNLLDGLKPKQ